MITLTWLMAVILIVMTTMMITMMPSTLESARYAIISKWIADIKERNDEHIRNKIIQRQSSV